MRGTWNNECLGASFVSKEGQQQTFIICLERAAREKMQHEIAGLVRSYTQHFLTELFYWGSDSDVRKFS